MNTDNGGPAFPVAFVQGTDPHGADSSSGNEGMTLLDWFAGQEEIGTEELATGICEHFAGPRPSGTWQTNAVEWYAWEAKWRAGIKYLRASAMLAEKRRRESADHSPEAGKMATHEASRSGVMKGGSNE